MQVIMPVYAVLSFLFRSRLPLRRLMSHEALKFDPMIHVDAVYRCCCSVPYDAHMYVACLLVGTDLASIIVGKSVENGRFLG